MNIRITPGRVVGLLCVLLIAFAAPCQVHAKPKKITVNALNEIDFILLKEINRKKRIMCQISTGDAGRGTVKKSGIRWANYKFFIKKIKRNRNFTAQQKKKKLKRLRKKKKQDQEECAEAIKNHQIGPPPSPSPSPSPSPAGPPGISISGSLVDFGGVEFEQTSAPMQLSITNTGTGRLEITDVSLGGFNSADFAMQGPAITAIPAGATEVMQLTFTPGLIATRLAELIISSNASATPSKVALIGKGVPGSDDAIRINCGGPDYTDSAGNLWMADQYFSDPQGDSDSFEVTNAINGTSEDALYQTERFDDIFFYNVPVENGDYKVVIHFAEIFWTVANKRVFDLSVEGVKRIDNLDLFATTGIFTAYSVSYDVTVADSSVDITLDASDIAGGGLDNAKISAIEIIPDHDHGSGSHAFLHVVVEAPSSVVDYDGDGSETVDLDGSESHTHEPGRSLTSWSWSESGTQIASGEQVSTDFTTGSHNIILTIEDSATPKDNLSGDHQLNVYPLNAVGGVLARYFPGTTNVVNLPAAPGFLESRAGFKTWAIGNKLGNSPFTADTVIALSGRVEIAMPGSYHFQPTGGDASRFLLNGVLHTAPQQLVAGSYAVEARFAASDSADLPVDVLLSKDGGTAMSILSDILTHDQSGILPFINTMPDSGLPEGGSKITLEGFGFFPVNSVSVNWGGTILSGAALKVTPFSIELTTPAGTNNDTIQVFVQTPSGQSNKKDFTYSNDGDVPIVFDSSVLVPEINPDFSGSSFSGPTVAAWGPDGRLYVGALDGKIFIYTFNDEYSAVTDDETITTLEGTLNPHILGIGFNPRDSASPPKVYVAHSLLYADTNFDNGCLLGDLDPYPYYGQISTLEGPNFDTATPLVTGLPVSNHDHGVNGIDFDNHGDLYIAIGGNTNAGVAACGAGELPESPLSGAIVKAELSKAGFNGVVQYVETIGGASNDDQLDGNLVDVAAGVDVHPYAPGTRNPFDVHFTTRGSVYGTDNGPNNGFGPASTGPASDAGSPHPTDDDEVLFFNQGHYYGHANRNRGRSDARQNIYQSGTFATPILGQYTAPISLTDSSTNGMDEYRATTFNGKIQGNLIAKKWESSSLYNFTLSADGRSISKQEIVTTAPGLDVVTGPGGALLQVDINDNRLFVNLPDDQGADAMDAYDIFPWRALSNAGNVPFVIGGHGFGTVGNTTVEIGGIAATVASVSATRIRGTIPVNASPTAELLDVFVDSNGETSTIPKAFRYLLPPGEGVGEWKSDNQMLVPLGEVAAGVINGVLYVVGNENPLTMAFDLSDGAWHDDRSNRPILGDHHAAEVINGKLYLFGGLGDGSEGTVQIFDPAVGDGGTWTAGATGPILTGGASTALIDGYVLFAGGIDSTLDSGNGDTVADMAVYDPSTNTWSTTSPWTSTALEPMPIGRNHTAATTDGNLFYVFGGRDGPNELGDGFNDVQIYDPQANTWTSNTLDMTIPPLPQARGGMGKAAYFRGEIYVIGGETLTDGSAVNGVYDRVDVYNPVTKTWRAEAPLPTARHGIFPIVYNRSILVAGGGIQSEHSSSKILEIFGR